MADESNPATSPGEAEAQPTPSEKLAEIEAQLGSQAAPNAEGQETSVQSQGASPLSGEVLVDWGEGVSRTVSIDTLVEAAKKQDLIAQREAAIQSKLEEMGTLSALGTHIENMDDVQRAQLGKLLQNPSLLTQMANGRSNGSAEDLASDMDDLIAGRGQGTPPQSNAEIEQLKQQIADLRQFAEASIAKDRSQSLSSRVEQSLKTFDVFKNDPDLLEYTKGSVINEHTMNPRVGLEQIIAKHATHMHKFGARQREGVATEVTGRAPSPTTPVNEKGWKPTADDMTSKKLLRHVLGEFGHK